MSVERPLLTIAIPTWNRCKTLDESLNLLLAQVEKYPREINIVISDNASDDETNLVINRYIDIYDSLDICLHTQSENTGYYGNFRKCKELSNGVYFWLLSDDDFVKEGVISKIVEYLRNKELSVLFLNGWGGHSSSQDIESNVNSFIQKYGARSTLVSTCIIRNDSSNDAHIFEEYKGSNFLCYAFVADCLAKFHYLNVMVINSPSLDVNEAAGTFSYDPFTAFIEEINQCLLLISDQKMFKKSSVIGFKNQIFKQVLLYHIYRKKMGFTDYKKYNAPKLSKRVVLNYWMCFSFWTHGIFALSLPRRLLNLISQIRSKYLSKVRFE